jgi:hypothetical protein
MKISQLIPNARILILGLIATFAIASFSSCNKEIPFLKSSVIPGAEGYVKVKQDKNNNYIIQVHVANMAGVDRLTPPRSSYIVWMDSDLNQPKSLGRLNTSNQNKASLETVSQNRPNTIFITAEDRDDVQFPGTLVVLTTTRF